MSYSQDKYVLARDDGMSGHGFWCDLDSVFGGGCAHFGDCWDSSQESQIKDPNFTTSRVCFPADMSMLNTYLCKYHPLHPWCVKCEGFGCIAYAIWEVFTSQIIMAAGYFCEWITNALTSDGVPWPLRISAFVLEPVCWLLKNPEWFVAVAALGLVFYFIGPLIVELTILAK